MRTAFQVLPDGRSQGGEGVGDGGEAVDVQEVCRAVGEARGQSGPAMAYVGETSLFGQLTGFAAGQRPGPGEVLAVIGAEDGGSRFVQGREPGGCPPEGPRPPRPG